MVLPSSVSRWRLAPVAEPPALANEICALLVDEGLRKRLGEAGKKFVETEHSQERVLARQFELYREIAAAHAVGR